MNSTNTTTEKRRFIRQNRYGNWKAYEGGKFVAEFGTREFDAKVWRDRLEQIVFIEGDFLETKFVKRDQLPVLSGQMTYWRI